MVEILEPVSNITRPKLMPNKAWTRNPSADEATIIPLWEEHYIRARATFERHDARAKGSYNKNTAPIAPDMYLRWLRSATQQYDQRNSERDPALRDAMRVTKATLAGLGFIDGPSRHGEVPLTVAPHYWRVKGENRGYVSDGDRVHMHHTPKYESVARDVEYNNAISIGLGERLHFHLHKLRDARRPYETRRQQVDGDIDFVSPHMHARGYTAREVERAREKAHDLNDDLGLYRVIR
jgi:hypothetical protein